MFCLFYNLMHSYFWFGPWGLFLISDIEFGVHIHGWNIFFFTAIYVCLPVMYAFIDKLCKKVGCGKGNCKASGNSILGYECECDPGWKQTLLQSDNSFKFLPCVIPNCSINFSCGEDAPAPAAPDKRANRTSFFEPCYWAECGGGSCMQTSALTYTCECSKGYSNLLNITGFPCFKECALGLDCNMTNKSSSPPTATPSLTHNNSNKASGFIDGGGLVLKSVAAVSVAMYFLK
ncbi:unnamed protein product [Cuscuta epithymum]|uniref:EGF-like domain-containing protein n=1 Tax=Cuscuta epithymum TaxID=186058 RepID=A0AAV0D8U5_9ASTE|nr:unnamed protein product [Cuscuta epithymum]